MPGAGCQVSELRAGGSGRWVQGAPADSQAKNGGFHLLPPSREERAVSDWGDSELNLVSASSVSPFLLLPLHLLLYPVLWHVRLCVCMCTVDILIICLPIRPIHWSSRSA